MSGYAKLSKLESDCEMKREVDTVEARRIMNNESSVSWSQPNNRSSEFCKSKLTKNTKTRVVIVGVIYISKCLSSVS